MRYNKPHEKITIRKYERKSYLIQLMQHWLPLIELDESECRAMHAKNESGSKSF